MENQEETTPTVGVSSQSTEEIKDLPESDSRRSDLDVSCVNINNLDSNTSLRKKTTENMADALNTSVCHNPVDSSNLDKHCALSVSHISNPTSVSQNMDSVSNQGMESTLGIKNMFSSTLNESLLDKSVNLSFAINESAINVNNASSVGLESEFNNSVSDNIKNKVDNAEMSTPKSNADSASTGFECVNQASDFPSENSSNVMFQDNKEAFQYNLEVQGSVSLLTSSNVSTFDSTVGIKNLYKSANDTHTSTEAVYGSLNNSVCNLSMDVDNADKSLHFDNDISNIPLPNSSLQNIQKSVAEVAPQDISQNGLSLNSSLGLSKLYTTITEPAVDSDPTVQIENTDKPTAGSNDISVNMDVSVSENAITMALDCDKLNKSGMERANTDDNSVNNSAIRIPDSDEPHSENLEVEGVSLMEVSIRDPVQDNINVNSVIPAAHEISTNNSSLITHSPESITENVDVTKDTTNHSFNSTLGVNNLYKSISENFEVNQSSSGIAPQNISGSDSDNLKVSDNYKNEHNYAQANTTATEANNTEELPSCNITKLSASLVEAPVCANSMVFECSINSTLGVDNLYKSVTEQIDSGLDISSENVHNVSGKIMVNNSINSTLGIDNLYSSSSEQHEECVTEANKSLITEAVAPLEILSKSTSGIVIDNITNLNNSLNSTNDVKSLDETGSKDYSPNSTNTANAEDNSVLDTTAEFEKLNISMNESISMSEVARGCTTYDSSIRTCDLLDSNSFQLTLDKSELCFAGNETQEKQNLLDGDKSLLEEPLAKNEVTSNVPKNTEVTSGNGSEKTSAGEKQAPKTSHDGRSSLGSTEDMDETLINNYQTQVKNSDIHSESMLSGSTDNVSERNMPQGARESIAMDITRQFDSPPRETASQLFRKPCMPSKRPFVKDYPSTPERTILGEESLMMCRSIMSNLDDSFGEGKSVSPSMRALRYLANSPLLKRFKPSDRSELVKSSVSLDETSMCALDYSLPLSDCTGLTSDASVMTNKPDDLKDKKVSVSIYNLTTLNDTSMNAGGDEGKPRQSITGNQDESVSFDCSNNSGYMWDSYLASGEKSTLVQNQSLNATNVSDVRRFLSDNINKSLCTEQVLSPQEVILLRDNLALVLELLEKENNEFEEFRKSCETEKANLLAKIASLESQASDSTSDVSTSKSNDLEKQTLLESLKEKEKELDELNDKCTSSEEQIKKFKHDLDCMKNYCSLSEIEVPHFDALVSKLNSLGLPTDGILVQDMENVINLKTLLNILSSFLTNHNEFITKYNDLLENCKKDEVKLEDMNELIKNYDQNKSELSILQEKYNNLQDELKLNESTVADLQEKLLSYEEIKESLKSDKVEADAMTQKLIKLQKELAKTADSYSEIYSKYESLEKELIESKKYNDLLENSNLNKTNEIEISKLMLSYSTNVNMILRTEFKSLLNQFEDINSKYKVLTRVKDQLALNYESALSRIESLEMDYASAQELNKKYSEEVASLTDVIENSNLKISELEAKYVAITSQSDLSLSDIGRLTREMEELKLKYSETVNSLTDLQKSYSEKNEENKVTEEKVLYLTQNIKKTEEAHIKLSSDYNSIVSKYESECSKLNEMENEYSLLKKSYDEAVSKLDELQQLYSEKEGVCESIAMNMESLTEEIRQLKENLPLVNSTLEETALKYEVECSKVKSLEGELSQLHQKYEESCNAITKLKNESLEKKDIQQNLEKEINRLNAEIRTAIDDFNSMKADYEKNILDMNNLHSQLQDGLQQQINELLKELEDSISTIEQLREESEATEERLKENSLTKVNLEDQIKAITAELSEAKESLLALRSDYDSSLVNLEVERSNVKLLENELSALITKHEESLTVITKLEQESLEKEKYKEIIEEKLKLLTAEASEDQENLRLLKFEYDNTLINLENEKLKVKYFEEELSEALKSNIMFSTTITKMGEESLEKEETKDRLAKELNAGVAQMKELLEKFNKLKSDYDLSQTNLDVERSKTEGLENELSGLLMKYQESLAAKSQLEKTILEKEQERDNQEKKIDILAAEIASGTEEMEKLKLDYNDLQTNLENEKFKVKSLQEELSEVRTKNEESSNVISKLEHEMLEKEEIKTNYETKINNLTAELSETLEKFNKLQSEYNFSKSNLDSECLKVKELEDGLADLLLKYQESIEAKSALEQEASAQEQLKKSLEEQISLLTTEVDAGKDALSKLKSDYDNSLINLEKEHLKVNALEEELSEVVRKNKESCEIISKLELETQEKDILKEAIEKNMNSLASELSDSLEKFNQLKCEYDSSQTSLDNERLKVKSLEDELAALLEKHQESLSAKSALEQETLEKEQIKANLEMQINALTTEVDDGREKLEKLKSDYENAVMDLKNEQLKVKSIEEEFTDVVKKNQESSEIIAKLKEESLTKEQVSENLEKQVVLLTTEIKDIQDKFDQLKVDYEISLTDLADKSSSLTALKEDYTKLDNDFKELISTKEKLETDYSNILEANESNLKVMENLNSKISSAQEDFSNLKQDHLNTLSQLESETSKLNSLQSDLTNLEKKYQDVIEEKERLENDLQQKEKVMEEKEKLLLEFSNIKISYEEVVSEISELKLVHESKCAELNSLTEEKGDLECKYEKAVVNITALQNECSTKAVMNDELCQEIHSLKSKLSILQDSLNLIQTEYDQILPLYSEEQTKLSKLKKDYDDLQVKFQEALSKYEKLDADCFEFSNENERLNKEIVVLKEEILGVNEQLAALKHDYKNLTSEHSTERSKHTELRTLYNELLDRYYESFACIRELENQLSDSPYHTNQESENIEVTSVESLITKHGVYEKKYREVLSNVRQLLDVYSKSKLTNEKLEKDLSSMQDEVMVRESKIAELKEEYDLIYAKLQEENSKCNLLREQLQEFESKYTDSSSCLELLRKDYSDVLSEKKELQENNLSYKNQNDELKNNTELLKEDLKLSEEKIKDLTEKCDALSIELAALREEKLLREELERVNFELKAKCNDLEVDLSSKIENIQALELNLKNVEDKLNQENNSLKLENDDLTKKVSEFSSAVESIKLEVANLKDINCTLESTIEQKHSELNKATLIIQNYKQYEEMIHTLKSDFSFFNDQFTLVESNYSSSENPVFDTFFSSVEVFLKEFSKLSDMYSGNKAKLIQTQAETEKLNSDIKQLLEQLQVIKSQSDSLNEAYTNLQDKYKALKDILDQKEDDNKKLRSDKIKYEKEYQSSVDALRKTQEEMCNLEKSCDEKMARFTFVLKEKAEFENKMLGLLKQNDELTGKLKALTAKLSDFEKSHAKLSELEHSHSILTKEKALLEKQLTDIDKFKRENTDLKASLAVKDSKTNELMGEMKKLKNGYQQKSQEVQNLIERVSSLMPGKGDFEDTIRAVEDKLNSVKLIEEELEEERNKYTNLDEECNTLNTDLMHKEKMIGDMYKEHAEEMKSVKQVVEQSEKTIKEREVENESLKDKLKALEEEMKKVKTSKSSTCTSCPEFNKKLEKSKAELTEKNNKISSLQQHLEEFKTGYKKKVLEYRKKIAHLQDDLKKSDENAEVKKPTAETGSQTDAEPLKLTGQSGIVHSAKMKEMEEKLHKLEKDNHVLKKICQNRHQAIKDLQSKLDINTSSCSDSKKSSTRTVLSEVQQNK